MMALSETDDDDGWQKLSLSRCLVDPVPVWLL